MEPDELCSNNLQAMVSFADAVLEAAARETLSIGSEDALTCSLVSSLTSIHDVLQIAIKGVRD